LVKRRISTIVVTETPTIVVMEIDFTINLEILET
jgi:hypothetical protein